MRRNLLIILLAVEAAVCILLCIAQTSFSGVFTSAFAFPFEQIGEGLRALSLNGGALNIIAILIYADISLTPVYALVLIKRKRALCREDALLALLSVVLFAVLYLMINPGLMSGITGSPDGLTVAKAMLGIMVYSVLCAYIVLRFVRLFADGGTDKLIGYMAVLLGIIAALFVYMAFGACFNELLSSFKALREGNTGGGLFMSYVFLVIAYVIRALPHVLVIFVIFASLKLIDELKKDRYSPETEKAAGSMSNVCVRALVITVLSNVGFNMAQFLFMGSLRVVNIRADIPVLSIAFVLGALLLTRLISENKQLKDDNDMFI